MIVCSEQLKGEEPIYYIPNTCGNCGIIPVKNAVRDMNIIQEISVYRITGVDLRRVRDLMTKIVMSFATFHAINTLKLTVPNMSNGKRNDLAKKHINFLISARIS